MESTMKSLLLAVTSLLTAVSTFALNGKIIDEFGVAVANAEINIISHQKRYTSDDSGQFNIPLDNVDEIHVLADGFNHRVLHLHGQQQDNLTITLRRGVLEIVDVVGIPLHASQIESSQPISVISTKELRKKQRSTLGETLKNEVGIQTSYFGAVASSPIIRGLDGPRVLITQNGLDVSDASRVGPDHIVASETTTAQQIEILRGPATLFYGSGAIGGVVNIVDDRIPSDSEQKAALTSEYQEVNHENSITGAYTGGTDQFAYHIDGFWRDSDDYSIPGFAEIDTDEAHHDEDENEEEHEEEHSEQGTLANSASKSSGFNIGGSILLDEGYIGLSYGRLDRRNGIPGHGHEDEDEHEDDMNEHEEGEHEEEEIQSELDQNRWQLISELRTDNTYINAINTRIGYTDYEHREIHENEEEVGTVFRNNTLQARVDLLHAEFAMWKGAVSLEGKVVDFEAIGEEAFTPPSQTQEFAIAVLEEKHSGNFLWQLGARLEKVSLQADDIVLAHSEHNEQEDEEGEHEEEHAETDYLSFEHFEFTPFSFSAGIVWDFTNGYNTSLALSRSERAPSAAELFSAGPHLATRSYEAGALFEIHEEGDERHLDYVGRATTETSHNIDLSLRKFEGNIGFVVNLFYNEINNYYALTNTGLYSDDIQDHGEEDNEDTHEHDDNLPVYIFKQEDAVLSGLELEFAWQLNHNLMWTIWGDTVTAKLKNGEHLARTSPTRLASQLSFNRGPWSAQMSAVNYFDQNNISPNETPTDGYTIIDGRVSYAFRLWGSDSTIYLAGDNLMDQEARVHTSALKDQAPLPGRNIKLGLHATF